VNGEENLTERFNVNNKELNKRRFLESNAHVFKHKLNGKNLKGAKFSNQELDFNLSPDTGKLDGVFSQSSLPQKRHSKEDSDKEDLEPEDNKETLKQSELDDVVSRLFEAKDEEPHKRPKLSQEIKKAQEDVMVIKPVNMIAQLRDRYQKRQ